MHLTEARDNRFKSVISKRQFDLTVILENVHDPHNIGAVMRSCDAVGIPEIYILYTEKRLQQRKLVGESSSSGTKKWVKVHYYEDLNTCMEAIQEKYEHIWATHLGEDSKGLYEIDWTGSTALLFGNEHDGVSKEALEFATGNFIIPQHGMVQSLNISVACAVSLFEIARQRGVKGAYDKDFNPDDPTQKALYESYLEMQMKKA